MKSRYSRNTKSVQVVPLLFESYLSFIRLSVGSKSFQQFYCRVNGKKLEVMRDGQLSCAFFASAVLKLFSLIGNVQLTVHRTMDDLMKSGWRPIKRPRIGCVIIWDEDVYSERQDETYRKAYVGRHRHIGFYVGGGKAISSRKEKRTPTVHAWKFRPVEMLLWHPRLDKK